MGSRLLSRESNEQKLIWSLHRASPGPDCLHAVHLSFTDSTPRPKETVIPRHDWDLRAIFKLLATFSVVSLGSASPLDTSCTPRSETCMPCQDMVLNFPGRWIRRAVPTSGFSHFVTLNNFGVAGAPLSHFVSHVNIVRSSCTHVWRLRPRLWYLRFGTRSAQLTDCTQFFFFQRSYGWSRLTQPGTRALSRGSPPTEIRRRPVLRFPRAQDEYSIFRMQWCASLHPCDRLSHRCDTGTRVWEYEGATSVEDHAVAFVNHS